MSHISDLLLLYKTLRRPPARMAPAPPARLGSLHLAWPVERIAMTPSVWSAPACLPRPARVTTYSFNWRRILQLLRWASAVGLDRRAEILSDEAAVSDLS